MCGVPSGHPIHVLAVPEDYGLSAIAEQLGKTAALEMYWTGADLEKNGDVDGAIKLYRQAFKSWPALDGVTIGGLPLGVREEVILQLQF